MKFLDNVTLKVVDGFNGIELAEHEQGDLLLLEGVAFHDGVNANGAFIEKADAEKDIESFSGKPIRILWDGKNPTGHGLDVKTGKFSNKVSNIGYIHNAYIESSSDYSYEAIIQAVVWEKYNPEIAQRIRELHNQGNLKFSIEAERDFEVLDNGSRRCYNNNFRGLSIVSNPAWNKTRSLMVAEDENGITEDNNINSSVNEENALETIVEPNKAVTKTEPKTISPSTVEQETTNKEQNLDYQAQIVQLQQEVKSLTSTLGEYQKIVEATQREKLGQERLSKISSFGVTDKTVEDLGLLSQDEFINLYEEVITNYAQDIANGKKNAKQSDVVQAMFHKTNPKQVDNKELLLNVFKGLGK